MGGPNSASFLFIFGQFKHKFYRKNCRFQQESNSDRRNRRRAHWPLDPVVVVIELQMKLNIPKMLFVIILSKCFFLKKWANPGLFFVYFQSFQTNIITIFTTNICEKCPSSIWCQNLNPCPSECESLPITNRPGLPPILSKCYFNHILSNRDIIGRRPFWCNLDSSEIKLT